MIVGNVLKEIVQHHTIKNTMCQGLIHPCICLLPVDLMLICVWCPDLTCFLGFVTLMWLTCLFSFPACVCQYCLCFSPVCARLSFFHSCHVSVVFLVSTCTMPFVHVMWIIGVMFSHTLVSHDYCFLFVRGLWTIIYYYFGE